MAAEEVQFRYADIIGMSEYSEARPNAAIPVRHDSS